MDDKGLTNGLTPPASAAAALPMSERKLHREMHREGLSDAWWVAQHGAWVAQHPLSLERALRQGHPDEALLLLHESQTGAEVPPWVAIFPQDRLSEKQRSSLQKRNAQTISNITRQLLALGVVLVVMLVVGLNVVDDAEQTQQQPTYLDRLESSVAAREPTTPQEPRLRMVIAHTRYQFLVTNAGDEVWPRLVIELNGPEGYVQEYLRPLEPNQTITLRLNEFVREGTGFLDGEATIKKVRVMVPGFKEHTERL